MSFLLVCAPIHAHMYLFIHVPHKAVGGSWLASKNNHIVFTNWWHHLVVAANKSLL